MSLVFPVSLFLCPISSAEEEKEEQETDENGDSVPREFHSEVEYSSYLEELDRK